MKRIAPSAFAAISLFFVLYAANVPAMPVESLDRIIDADRILDPEIRTQSDVLSHYMMGIIYDNYGKPRKAVDEYKEALKKEKNIVEIYLRLGADLMLMNHVDEALPVIEEASSIDPENTRAHLLLAVIHAAKGEYGEAATQHQEILKYDPGNLRTLTFLSDVFIAQKKFDKAAEVYEKMLRIRNDDAFLYFNLGIIYSKLDLLDKAEEKLLKAIGVDENYLAAQILLGFIYEVNKDFDKAVQRYKKVLEIDPQNKDAYMRMVWVYCEQKDFDKAEKVNEQFRKIAPDSAEPYLNSFSICLYRGERDKAQKEIEEALDRGIKGAALYIALGYIYTLKEDHKSAAKAYENAVLENPGNGSYKFYLAAALEQSGEKQKAVSILKEITEEGINLPEAYNYLGYIYAEQGRNLEKAVELIEKALAKDPDNGAYIDSLGWVYYKMGKIEEAVAELEKAVELLPDDPIVIEHLADAYFKQGNRTKAVHLWNKALKFAPDSEALQKKVKENKTKKSVIQQRKGP